MWVETYAIITMIGVMLSFFLACQKNLPVMPYVLAGLVFPIPSVIAAAFAPSRA